MKRRRTNMRHHFCSIHQKAIACMVGLLVLLLVTGCAGVSSVGPNIAPSSTTNSSTPNSGPAVASSISFTGPVQSVDSNTIVVNLPNGQHLTARIVQGQTDLSAFQGALPAQGQTVNITVMANADG